MALRRNALQCAAKSASGGPSVTAPSVEQNHGGADSGGTAASLVFGPNLTGTQTRRLQDAMAALNDAAAKTQGIWLSFISFATYYLISMGTVTHTQLLLETPFRLPIIDAELPLVPYFWVAPLLLFLLHSYSLLHIWLLADNAAQLNRFLADHEISVDRQNETRLQISNFVFAQMLAGPTWNRTGFFAYVLRLIGFVTLAILPMFGLLLTQVQFLPYHGEATLWWIRALIAFDVLLLSIIWVRPERRSIMAPARRTLKSITKYILIALLSALLLATSWILVAFDEETIFARVRELPFVARVREKLFDQSFDDISRRPASPFSDSIMLPYYDFAEHAAQGDGAPKLSRLSLRKRRLEGAFLRNASLRGIDLTGAFLQGADLIGADLEGALMESVSLSAANLTSARLQQADMKGAILNKAILDRADLHGAILVDAELRSASLMDAEVQMSILSRADLSGAELTRAKLKHALLDGASMLGANLHGTDLSWASLTNTVLVGADLKDAILQGTKLANASLIGVSLLDADLAAADLNGVDLRRAEGHPKTTDSAMLFRAKFGCAPLEVSEIENTLGKFAQVVKDGFISTERGARLRAATDPKSLEGCLSNEDFDLGYTAEWSPAIEFEDVAGGILPQRLTVVARSACMESDSDIVEKILLEALTPMMDDEGHPDQPSPFIAREEFARRMLGENSCGAARLLTDEMKRKLQDIVRVAEFDRVQLAEE